VCFLVLLPRNLLICLSRSEHLIMLYFSATLGSVFSFCLFVIAASDSGSSKSYWCSLSALFPRFWAFPCTGTVCCCAFSIIPFGNRELFAALLSFWFSSQDLLPALLPWGCCCCCFSGVHYPHIIHFLSSGTLSSHTPFSYKLLLRSDFQGFFALRKTQI